MKKIISFIALSFVATSAMAADMTPAQNRGRSTQSAQMRSAPRSTGPKVVVGGGAGGAVNETGSVAINVESAVAAPVNMIDTPEYKARKAACLNNNIGIGNTFVWASRFGDTTNYATMIEDLNTPENNTCFVKVTLKSNDDKIQIDDAVANRYYEWNNDITCGGWIDEGKMEKAILDAKKSGRVLTTVGVAVASAGVGVGAMELFGNKLIGGKVEGQQSKKVLENQGEYVKLFATMLCDDDGMQKKKAGGIKESRQSLFNDVVYMAIKCAKPGLTDAEGAGICNGSSGNDATKRLKHLVTENGVCLLKKAIEDNGGCGIDTSGGTGNEWNIGDEGAKTYECKNGVFGEKAAS